ncbi:MAG: hypothetical protein WDO70_08730 [Alphaproteobacteria bacterium]
MLSREWFDEQRKVLHGAAETLAFRHYLRAGRIPSDIQELTQALSSLEALCDYHRRHNPNWPSQPRAPQGGPDGGQWTGGGGGSGGVGHIPDDIDDPPLESVYPIEYLAVGLASAGAAGARAAVELLLGIGRSVGSSLRIRRAAKAIEDYLGGKPDRVFQNPADDLVIMRGDKKIRFDINNYSPHDEPHFHVQKGVQNGNKIDWDPAGDKHWYPFRKE